MKKPTIIPPHVAGFLLTLQIPLLFFMKQFRLILFPYTLFGIPFIIGGIGLIIATNHFFRKYKTTITYGDSTHLITVGPMRYSRNPMYLGMCIFLFGCAFVVGNILGFALPLIALAIFHRYFIPYEEYRMRQTFGDSYRHYTENVRRWI
ncbi:MAG: hypothetical protein GF344_12105 [Chitinivibrionales bacterium]|nr:hypothetical protein [Chitinivibrionales bacterium]